MEELAEELLETTIWLPEYDRQTNWYREYLDKLNQELKAKTIRA